MRIGKLSNFESRYIQSSPSLSWKVNQSLTVIHFFQVIVWIQVVLIMGCVRMPIAIAIWVGWARIASSKTKPWNNVSPIAPVMDSLIKNSVVAIATIIGVVVTAISVSFYYYRRWKSQLAFWAFLSQSVIQSNKFSLTVEFYVNPEKARGNFTPHLSKNFPRGLFFLASELGSIFLWAWHWPYFLELSAANSSTRNCHQDPSRAPKIRPCHTNLCYLQVPYSTQSWTRRKEALVRRYVQYMRLQKRVPHSLADFYWSASSPPAAKQIRMPWKLSQL